MGKLKLDITMSLDGYVAGPNPTLENPLGESGELLHQWITGLATWRETHGRREAASGTRRRSRPRERGAERRRDHGQADVQRRAGPWEDDSKADAWWGEEPPFHTPVFILTHHEREPVPKPGGTTFSFVTDGIESALEQARAGAGDKDVIVGGGAEAAQQYLKAGWWRRSCSMSRR